MGSRNPERDRPSIDPAVRLADFLHRTGGDWAIGAYCCACMRSHHFFIEDLLALKRPPVTIGEFMQRVVCQSCGCRRPTFTPRFVGKLRN